MEGPVKCCVIMVLYCACYIGREGGGRSDTQFKLILLLLVKTQ